MPKWLRRGLISILAIVAAALWAFFAAAMHAPSQLVSFGSLIIFVGIMGWGLKG